MILLSKPDFSPSSSKPARIQGAQLTKTSFRAMAPFPKIIANFRSIRQLSPDSGPSEPWLKPKCRKIMAARKNAMTTAEIS